jgi:hypothetical protein
MRVMVGTIVELAASGKTTSQSPRGAAIIKINLQQLIHL